ncbi:MAG: CBS domain-containing protein [Cuniculiplasma divulgatum]|jgi:CBS domain-containing protein|nr:MAG: CBS domain-containing protein [Cuniculiplasma divulgatum]
MPGTAADIMTRNPITYHVPSTVGEVIKILIKNNITGLPLVDQSGKYAGVISRRDIFENPDENQTAMVMRRAKAVAPDTTVEEAAREMIKQFRRHLAVVDDSGNVVGILTPQNFLRLVRERFGKLKVKEIERSIAVPVWEESPLSVVSFIMRVSKAYACPVIDINGDFVGLVTDRDIFDNIDVRSKFQFSETGMADDEDPWSWEGIRNVVTYMIEKSNLELPHTPVKQFMIKNPVVANSTDTVEAAAKKMETGNYNQLPIVQGNGHLVGMLQDIQILSVFL